MPSPYQFEPSDTLDNLINLTKLSVEIETSAIGRAPSLSTADKDFETGEWVFHLSFSPDLNAAEELVLAAVVAAHLGEETPEEVNEAVGITAAVVGVPNGVPSLDSGGKIPSSMLPAQSLPQVYVVSDASARNALTVEEGDEAIQTNDGSHWVYDGSSWYERPIGTGDVVGPNSVTANSVPRFDGTSGKLIKSGQMTEDNSGNVLIAGTLNGRNVSADGVKLDLIEPGATADQDANEVPFSSNGDIIAGNVQDAIVEVRDDADAKLAGKLSTSHQGAGGAAHADATTSSSGFMSSVDKTKLDNIAPGAQVNVIASVFGRTGSVTAQSADYAAAQISYDNSTSGLDSTDVKAALDELAEGGGNTPAQYFSAADVAGGTIIPSSIWTDIPLDTEFRKDSIFTHVGASSQVVVTETNVYLVVAEVTSQVVSGSSRSQLEMRVLHNGTELPGTRAGMYARKINEGTATGSVTRVVSLTAGDTLSIQAQRVSGGSSTATLPNGSRLNLVLLKAEKGEQGDSGSSGVELQKEGSSVAGGPFTTLNLVGPQVNATDAGGGVALITVAPERFYIENDAEQTTGSGSFVTALTLNFTASGGTYDIDWYFEAKNGSAGAITRTSVSLNGSNIAFSDIFVGEDATVEVPTSGFKQTTLTAGPHTVTIDYSRYTGSYAAIRRARLRVRKVGNA